MTDEEIIEGYRKYLVLYSRLLRRLDPGPSRAATRKYRLSHLAWDKKRKHDARVKQKIKKVKGILGLT